MEQKYDLESLIETWTIHAQGFDKDNIFGEQFNLPQALLQICQEIQLLKNEIFRDLR